MTGCFHGSPMCQFLLLTVLSGVFRDFTPNTSNIPSSCLLFREHMRDLIKSQILKAKLAQVVPAIQSSHFDLKLRENRICLGLYTKKRPSQSPSPSPSLTVKSLPFLLILVLTCQALFFHIPGPKTCKEKKPVLILQKPALSISPHWLTIIFQEF